MNSISERDSLPERWRVCSDGSSRCASQSANTLQKSSRQQYSAVISTAIEGVSGTGLEAQSSQTDAVKSLIRWESPHPLSIAGVDYCRGLLRRGERKSVEPIAAVTAPARVSAKHQSLLHFVANAPWSNERVLSRIEELILPVIEGSGAIEAWIIDDTGFAKKGRHSVGVARQY